MRLQCGHTEELQWVKATRFTNRLSVVVFVEFVWHNHISVAVGLLILLFSFRILMLFRV